MTLAGKRVLVTGGSGFIASHLVRTLADQGADVYVMTKYNSIFDNIRLADLWDRITVLEADIRNQDSLRHAAALNPEIIYHFAAYNHVGDSFLHVAEAIDSNAKGSANVLEAFDNYERFVYISSSEVYGYQEHVPFREDAVLYPLSPYAVGKCAGELYARMKWRQGMPVVVVRPFNAYGPYQSPRAIIAELILKSIRGEPVLTTEGVQTRDFNYVRDLVEGFVLAAVVENAAGEVINLGTGSEISIRDLARLIHKLTDSTSELSIGALPYRPTEIPRMVADNAKARKLLGWEPRTDLHRGLQLTIAWYRHLVESYGDTFSALANRSAYEDVEA